MRQINEMKRVEMIPKLYLNLKYAKRKHKLWNSVWPTSGEIQPLCLNDIETHNSLSSPSVDEILQGDQSVCEIWKIRSIRGVSHCWPRISQQSDLCPLSIKSLYLMISKNLKALLMLHVLNAASSGEQADFACRCKWLKSSLSFALIIVQLWSLSTAGFL